MSGAKRDFFEDTQRRPQYDPMDYLQWWEQQQKQSTEKGQPSPVNDGTLKGNDHGIYRN